jgi:hypothetical protein
MTTGDQFSLTNSEVSWKKNQNNDTCGLKRLKSKDAKNAIIQNLTPDFNPTPIIAEAFYV